MYSKLILFFFKGIKFLHLISAFKQRRKVLKNTTNIRFFSICMREKEIFLE